MRVEYMIKLLNCKLFVFEIFLEYIKIFIKKLNFKLRVLKKMILE
jgi:hypothetical protein